MDTISILQEKPRPYSFAFGNEVFADELHQLLYGKGKSALGILFTIRDEVVFILFVRHTAQEHANPEDFEEI